MIDRTTRWFEAAPMCDINAETVLDTFLVTWVARYGIPACITTDRGTQFTSSMWTTWCNTHHVESIHTTAFHPQANGMVERLHRQIKEAIRARGAANTGMEHLPWILLALWTTPKDETNISAAQAALGVQPVLPGQPPCPPSAELSLPPPPPSVIPPTRKTYREAWLTTSQLDNAEWVYVRHGGARAPLEDSYDGPFKVMERGNKVFKLKIGDKLDTVTRDRLKPHTGELPPEPAVPKRRGRPPGTGGGSGASSAAAAERTGGPV